MINDIKHILKQKTEQFAINVGAKYLGEQVLSVKRVPSVVAQTVEFTSFRMHIAYRVGRPRGPKSTLSCLFFSKTDVLGLGFQIYDLLNVIDEGDFSPYTYAYLPDADAISGACDELLQKLTSKIEKINELFDSPESVAKLREAKMT